MCSNEPSTVARWGSLKTSEKAGCLQLEGWPSIKHAFQLFIPQPLSEQHGGTGRQAGVGGGEEGFCSASEIGNFEL